MRAAERFDFLGHLAGVLGRAGDDRLHRGREQHDAEPVPGRGTADQLGGQRLGPVEAGAVQLIEKLKLDPGATVPLTGTALCPQKAVPVLDPY